MTLLGSAIDRVKAIPQHRAERKLTKQVLAEYANDPDVVFEQFAPRDENAPHGVNVPDEMAVTDADPDTD